MLLNAVAKYRRAPGARSCTIWIIARPSSLPAASPEPAYATGCENAKGAPTLGRSPLAMSAAAAPAELKLSDSTPTHMPAPVNPSVLRTSLAR